MSRYTYDDLDRLLTSSVPAGESFAYDSIGNMTSKAGTTLDYGTTSPKHAVKSHGSTTYTYDANGSMTARGTQTIKYDPEQRPIRIQDGTSIHRAAYDGDGVRRKREDSNGTVHYLGGYERKLAGGSNSPEAVTKYYSASFGAMSRPLAFRRGGTLHWLGADHLGGTVRVLDDSFTALDGMRYRPFGEDRDAGTGLNTDRKFTGQTEDEAAGLYWYASRAYDPAIGRFCSPDPIVPEPGNPQALNRYSYVYNNPLKFVDPSGHSAEWFNEAWREEFWEVHGKAPTQADYEWRYASMVIASGGHLSPIELPNVPLAPEGVDIDENIKTTLAYATVGNLLSFTSLAHLRITIHQAAAMVWFRRIQPGGEWDYKLRRDDDLFENFGNFNFGATGAALGIPDETLLKGAGFVHQIQGVGGGQGEFSILPGKGEYPYGDDPRDSAQIKAGIHYYRLYRLKQQLDPVLQVRAGAKSILGGH